MSSADFTEGQKLQAEQALDMQAWALWDQLADTIGALANLNEGGRQARPERDSGQGCRPERGDERRR